MEEEPCGRSSSGLRVALTRGRELSAHRHEEGVERVVLDTINLDLAAVEATAQLDASLLVDVGGVPCLVQRALGRELGELLLELERVEGAALCDDLRPVLAERALELFGVDRQVLAGGQSRLLGNRVVCRRQMRAHSAEVARQGKRGEGR